MALSAAAIRQVIKVLEPLRPECGAHLAMGYYSYVCVLPAGHEGDHLDEVEEYRAKISWPTSSSS